MSAAFKQPDTLDRSSVVPFAKVTLAMQLLPKTVMRELRQCDTDRLTRLKSELASIELWESDYYRGQVHDDIDTVAHRNRLERREELLGEIVSITRPHARVVQLRYSLLARSVR
jgi:hypothetical protein